MLTLRASSSRTARVPSTLMDGSTSLMLACERHHDDVVRKLMGSGALPAARDESGRTALLRAVEKGDPESTYATVKLFLELMGQSSLEDVGARAALQKARQRSHWTTVNLLDFLLGAASPLANLCDAFQISVLDRVALHAAGFHQTSDVDIDLRLCHSIKDPTKVLAALKGLHATNNDMYKTMAETLVTLDFEQSGLLEAYKSFCSRDAVFRENMRMLDAYARARPGDPARVQAWDKMRLETIASMRKCLDTFGSSARRQLFLKYEEVKRVCPLAYATVSGKNLMCLNLSQDTTLEEAQAALTLAQRAVRGWKAKRGEKQFMPGSEKYMPATKLNHAITAVYAYTIYTLATMLNNWTAAINRLGADLQLLAREAAEADAAVIESLILQIRDTKFLRERYEDDLEDALAMLARGEVCSAGYFDVPKLQSALSRLPDLAALHKQLRERRERTAQRTKAYYPEQLKDAKWCKRVGLIEVTREDLLKLSIWMPQATRYSFRKLARLSEREVSVVDKVVGEGGRMLVLKTYQFRDNDSDWEARFCRQVKALAKIESAHIVHLEGAFIDASDSRTACILMPYYPGGDLAEWIRKNPLADMATRKRIAIGVLSGVHDLHQRGIVHCDIKPSNAFLTSTLSPVLGDFEGVQVSNVGLNAPLLVTDRYMAPELERGAVVEKVTPAIDLYSVGVLLTDLFGDVPGTPLGALCNKLRSNAPNKRPSAMAALRNPALAT